MRSEEEFWQDMCIAVAGSDSCLNTLTPAQYANAAVESYKNKFGEFPESNREMLREALELILKEVGDVI